MGSGWPGGLEEPSIGVGLEEGWKMVWAGPLAMVYPTPPQIRGWPYTDPEGALVEIQVGGRLCGPGVPGS